MSLWLTSATEFTRTQAQVAKTCTPCPRHTEPALPCCSQYKLSRLHRCDNGAMHTPYGPFQLCGSALMLSAPSPSHLHSCNKWFMCGAVTHVLCRLGVVDKLMPVGTRKTAEQLATEVEVAVLGFADGVHRAMGFRRPLVSAARPPGLSRILCSHVCLLACCRQSRARCCACCAWPVKSAS